MASDSVSNFIAPLPIEDDALSIARSTPFVSMDSTSVAEGLGELAEIQTQIFDGNNNSVNPTAVAGILEYTVMAGEKFIVRTRARDLRPSPVGVFSTYVDFAYATQGSPASELAQVLWGEYQEIIIPASVIGGSFTLTYGSETTAPIPFSASLTAMSSNVQVAIGALNFVGTVDNVKVITKSNADFYTIGINFRGSLGRQDVINAAIGRNDLTSSSGGNTTLQVSSSADPSFKNVLAAAVSYPTTLLAQGETLSYQSFGGFVGQLQASATTGYRIDDVGNFGTVRKAPEFTDPSAFITVFDTAFVAASKGLVDFSVLSSGNPRLGVSLFGSDDYLLDSQVKYPAPFRLRIAPKLEAVNDSFSIVEDSFAGNLNVLANDTIDASVTASITDVSQPVLGAGSVSISTDRSSVVLFPGPNFSGSLTFSYTILDNFGFRRTASVTVLVEAINDPPIANSFSSAVIEDSILRIAASSVLANDLPGPTNAIDEQSQNLTVIDVARLSTKGGSVTPTMSGLNVVDINYTPAPNFQGTDTFTYTISDNFATTPLTNTGTITVTVAAVNDKPIFTVGSDPTTDEDSGDFVQSWATRIFAAAGLASVPPTAVDESSQSISFIVLSNTNPGLFSVTPSVSTDGRLRFTAAADKNGFAILTLAARDSGASTVPDENQSDIKTFTITITPVNDRPVAVNDNVLALWNTVTNVNATNVDVLSNDIDIDSPFDSASLQIGTKPLHGNVVALPNGKLAYTPDNGYHGADRFTYRITDSSGATSSEEATVTIRVNAVPIATPDNRRVLSGTAVTIAVLSNDRDEDGNTTINVGAVLIVGQSPEGVAVALPDGTIRFTPTTGFVGTTTLRYKIVDDAQTASELAIVTLNVVAAYFQNGVLRFDVDGDGQVSPIDVLIIINDLRRNGPRDLRPTDFPPIFFVDINGSGSVEPLDVLQVINFLFRQSRSGTGEGSKNDDLESSISSIAFETLERMRNVARSNLRLSP